MGGGKKKRQSRTSEQLILDDFNAAVSEIHKGSDRVAAIMGGTVVDAALTAAIMSKLDDPSDAAKLFDDLRGPFSNFYSRILAGKVLGLFDADTADELHRIRQIRNVFAHSMASLDFTSAQIAEKCANLRHGVQDAHKSRGISDQRGGYEDACYALFTQLLLIWKVNVESLAGEIRLAKAEGRKADAKRLIDRLCMLRDRIFASDKGSD